MKKAPFTGSAVAIVTPLNENGIDYEAYDRLIEFQLANSTDAIVVAGTTGEASTLTDEEHVEIIRYTVEKVAGRVPVIAGTGSNDTAYAIELSKAAEKAGADALLLVTPYYNKTSQRGLYYHFKLTADAVKIPVILYNVPGRTGVNISVDTCKKLSEVENIVAIKEASGDIGLAAKIAAACGDNLYLYSGNDDMITPMLSLGGKGVISVLANVCPKETHDLCASYFEGDVKKSAALQLEYLDLVDALFCEVNPIPVKTALNMMGFEVGELRLPLYEMADANKETLRKALINHGCIK